MSLFTKPKLFTWKTLQPPSWDHARSEVVSSFRGSTWPRPVDGCWIWTGSHTRDDYGRYSGPWLREFAHRLSYEMNVGDVKTGVVCHRCDTPPCVNPFHLFRGSPSLNSFDMHAKGRGGRRPNDERLRTFKLIVDARTLRWTSDLLAFNGCPSGTSGVRCVDSMKCSACRKRERVLGLHAVRGTLDGLLSRENPTYLLKLLTDEERGYVEKVARG